MMPHPPAAEFIRWTCPATAPARTARTAEGVGPIVADGERNSAANGSFSRRCRGGALLLAVAALGFAAPILAASEARRPNIVLILADDK